MDAKFGMEVDNKTASGQNAAMKLRIKVLAGAAALVLLAIASPVARSVDADVNPVTAQGLSVSLDTDISDGPCTDIDSDLSVSPGQSFQVAICVDGLFDGLLFYQVDVLYDDAVLSAPEVENKDFGLDDNPDANAGVTTWGASLGETVDCSYDGMAFPSGNRSQTAGQGDALITCVNYYGPWPLGQEATKGVLAVITFEGLKSGNSDLTLYAVQLGDPRANEMGSCNPVASVPMTCNNATVTVLKKGEAPPTRAEGLSSSTPGQGEGSSATPNPGLATAVSSHGESRGWLLPTSIGISAAVVVALLSLAFYLRRRAT